MDTAVRTDIDVRDIIARIAAEMEEVIGLIHRPICRPGSEDAAVPPQAGDELAMPGRAEAA